MSITRRGVRLKRTHQGRLWLIGFVLAEVVLTFFLYISLAANIVWPEQSEAAVGVAKVLSYEGRLTDTSGNPLGGTGTVYCFRFSIYDNPTVGSGTKLWPTGAPTTTTSTVTDGVFDALIGSADTLDYNFYSNDTIYLNVEANTTTVTCGGTWETLSPRQRIASTGYALTAGNVYGDLLKTDIANTKVQLGTGTGVASGQILMALDVKNTTSDTIGGACSPSGTLWYNSVNTRALVCDNGTVQEIGNLGTLVGLKEAAAGSAITSGTVVFSGINGISVTQNGQTLSVSGLNAFGVSNIGNTLGATAQVTGNVVLAGGNNITLSQNGSTITISGGAGGGAATYYSTVLGKKFGGASTVTSLSQNSIYLFPEIINANIVASVVKMPVSILASSNTSASRQVGFTAKFGVYTRNATNSTVLSQHYSTSYTLAVSWNSNTSMALSMITAVGNSTSYNTTVSTSNNGIALSSLIYSNREFIMPWNTTLPPGEYWFAILNSSSSAGGAIANALSVSYVGAASLTNAAIGVATSIISGNNIARNIGLGAYSATTGVLPAAISMTQIARVLSNPVPVIYMLSVTQ